MEQLTTLILNSGTTVVMLAYFIYRDLKFMQKHGISMQVRYRRL